jgi:hypothetical protein
MVIIDQEKALLRCLTTKFCTQGRFKDGLTIFRLQELQQASLRAPKNLSKNYVLKGTGFSPYVESPFLISGFSR